MADNIGEAYVSIRPQLDGFREELRAGLDSAMEGVGDRTVRIDADTDQADVKITETAGLLDDLDEQTATPEIRVDPDSARGQLQSFRDSLDDLGADTATPNVRIDDTEAEATLAELRAQLDELATRAATIKIGTSGQARKDIGDIQAALDAVGNETLRPRVDDSDLLRLSGDLEGLETRLRNTSTEADRTAASLGGGGGAAAASSGGGLLGALIPLAPALLTVGAVGAGGLAAIGIAAGAATLGLGAFALAASGELAQVKTQAQGLLTTWQGTTEAFTKPVIQDAVGLLPGVFRLLTPAVATASQAFQGLEDKMAASLGSPFLRNFSTFIAGEGGAAITSFGSLIGGLGHAFAGFAEGFAPEITTIEGDLTRWGAALTQVGNEAANGGFSGFLNYIQANGPLVAHTFEDLGGVVVTLAKDMAPLGPVVLKIVDAAAGLLNGLLSLNPTLTTWGLGLAGVALEANSLLKVLGAGGLAGAAKGLPAIFSGIGDAATIGATGVFSVATAATRGGAALSLLAGAGTALEGGLYGVVYSVLNATGAFQSFDAASDSAGKSWSQNFVNSLATGTDKVASVQAQIVSTQQTLTALGNVSQTVSYMAGSGLASWRGELGKTLAQMGPFGQSLIALGFNPTEKFTDAISDLGDQTSAEQGRLKGLQGLLPGLTQAQNAQTAATSAANTAMGVAAGYTGDYATQFGVLAGQLKTANAAFAQSLTLLSSMQGSTLSAEQANTAFQAAVQTLTGSLKTNGLSMDGSTVKGLANRQAWDGVAGSMLTVISNMEKQGATSDQIVGKTSALTGYVIAMGAQYHLTAGQVTNMLTQIGLTPAQVKTELIASGYDTTQAAAANVTAAIDQIPKTTTVFINTVLTTSIPGHPGKGALPGNATGIRSSPGGWSNIAEAGPEAVIIPGGPVAVVKQKSVVDLPAGAQVLTASDTRKAIPGFATGTGLGWPGAQPVAITINDQRTVTVGDIASTGDVLAILDDDRQQLIAAIGQLVGTG